MKLTNLTLAEVVEYAENGASQTFGQTADATTVSFEKVSTGIRVKVNLSTASENTGEAANDTFGPNTRNLIGTNYNDILIGNNQDNSLAGGAGDDFLSSTNGAVFALVKADFPMGADTFNGGAGNDTVSYSFASAGLTINLGSTHYGFANTGDAADDTLVSIENLTGTNYNDVLVGDGGSNILDGGAGSDILIGGLGADKLYDKGTDTADRDTVSYAAAQAAVGFEVVYSMTGYGEAADDKYDGIEDFIGSAFGDYMGIDSKANIVDGGGGSDTITGYGGADTIKGGDGIDFVSFRLSDAVNANLLGQANTGGHAQGDVYESIEGLIGYNWNDVLTGNNVDNTLDGGGGVDRLTGNGGNDLLLVDNSLDVVVEAVGGGTDTVKTSADYTLAAGVEVEFLTSTKTFATKLTGNEFNTVITGTGGNDTIDGGTGADTLNGGGGDDTYIVNDARTVVADTAGKDVIQTSVTLTAAQTVGVDRVVLLGKTALNTAGDSLNNVIIGNDGKNKLAGGLGNDTITGKKGKDSFVFDTKLNKRTNVDKITDFNAKDDTFLLKKQGVFTKLNKKTLKAGDFYKIGDPVKLFQDKSDKIIYDQKAGQIYYDADGFGGKAKVLFATVKKNTYLDHKDFMIF